jgi:uncharacterized protein (TIGR00369 family)
MSLHSIAPAGFTVEAAQELLRTNFAPWVQDLGLVVESCEREGVVMRMPWTPRLARFGNTMSGQAMLAAADSTIAIAICGALGGFRNMTTVTQTMSFMRAIPEGDVRIEAGVRKLGRSLVFAEATFLTGRGEPICAHAVATWALIS